MQNENFNKDIQALRGLAILFVVYYHIIDAVPNLKKSMGGFADLFHGGTGVDLFFVISGYVITRSMYRHVQHGGRVTAIDAIKFWIRRTVRTIPPALIWLGICLLIIIPLPWFGKLENNLNHAIAAAGQFANFFIYSHGPKGDCGMFGYYWSLSTEEQFYIILPVVMLLLTRVQLKWFMLIGGLILSFLFSNFPSQIGVDFNLMNLLPFRADGLMLGVAIALFQDTKIFVRIIKFINRHIFIAMSIAFMLHIILWTHGTPLFSQYISPYIMNGLICSLLVILSLGDKGVTTFFEPLKSSLSFLGNISYSMYLCHMLIILLLQNWTYSKFNIIHQGWIYAWYIPLLIILIISISYISYWVIEKPFQRLSRKLVTIKSNEIINTASNLNS
ncbi:acyltransferase family protein [Clostridium butyricum]|uniref:acyltransferase family protein n=1 Tax=Clostridium butyricum TaxID=1492 RepID=UPI00374E6229